MLVDERIRIRIRFARVLHANGADNEVLLHETAQDGLGDVLRLERLHGGREELERCQGQLRRDLVRRLVRVLHCEVAEVLQRLALLPAPLASVVH